MTKNRMLLKKVTFKRDLNSLMQFTVLKFGVKSLNKFKMCSKLGSLSLKSAILSSFTRILKQRSSCGEAANKLSSAFKILFRFLKRPSSVWLAKRSGISSIER